MVVALEPCSLPPSPGLFLYPLYLSIRSRQSLLQGILCLLPLGPGRFLAPQSPLSPVSYTPFPGPALAYASEVRLHAHILLVP